jgi:hypothetical protein
MRVGRGCSNVNRGSFQSCLLFAVLWVRVQWYERDGTKTDTITGCPLYKKVCTGETVVCMCVVCATGVSVVLCDVNRHCALSSCTGTVHLCTSTVQCLCALTATVYCWHCSLQSNYQLHCALPLVSVRLQVRNWNQFFAPASVIRPVHLLHACKGRCGCSPNPSFDVGCKPGEDHQHNLTARGSQGFVYNYFFIH